MSCTIEDMQDIKELMESMERNAMDAEIAFVKFKTVCERTPNHFGYKKHRKCNNAKRPKPRKKKRK